MKKYKKLTTEQMDLSKKRFKKLLEYSYINNEDDLLLDEADDESQEDTDNEPMQQNMDNPEVDSGDMEQGAMDDQETSGEDMGQDVIGDEEGVNGDTDDMNGDNADMMGDIEGDDTMGEVEVDVTDLTAKQEDIDGKVTTLSQQTETLLNTLIQLSNKIDNMSQKSDTENQMIRKEIERRNPTPVEKLQKRIVVSDPFNETPEEYWKKKEADGSYKLVDDDNEEEVFTITPSDLGDNANEIYKSLGFTDDEFNQSLESMFRM